MTVTQSRIVGSTASYALNLFLEEEGADIGDAFLYFHVPECARVMEDIYLLLLLLRSIAIIPTLDSYSDQEDKGKVCIYLNTSTLHPPKKEKKKERLIENA